MSSSKRSRSASPQASKSRSHHRSKRSRSGGKHREEHSKDNSTSPIVLNQILEKIKQLSSHMEKIDGRLDLLESTRTYQAELQNSQLPLERKASYCHPAFEEERLEYFYRLSVTASPDHILDDSSPNVDNHDGHRVAPMTSKSLDPVQNVNEDEASMPQSQHGEQSRLEDGISEKPRFYNPTADSPGWAPSDSFKEFQFPPKFVFISSFQNSGGNGSSGHGYFCCPKTGQISSRSNISQLQENSGKSG